MSLARIPVFGPLLAAMSSFALPALAGAVSVEPTLWLHQLLAEFFPSFANSLPSALVYGLTGLLGGAFVKLFGPKFGLSAASATQLATAVASAAGGVGYYKMRTEGTTSSLEEAAGLALAGVSPMGLLATDGLAGLALAGSLENMPAYGDPGAYQVFPAQGMRVY